MLSADSRSPDLAAVAKRTFQKRFTLRAVNVNGKRSNVQLSSR